MNEKEIDLHAGAWRPRPERAGTPGRGGGPFLGPRGPGRSPGMTIYQVEEKL
ncbi:hypothetical protein EFR01_27870 [Sinorhizobium fredii]|nr:hypothetical protein EFR01_27870 [Sinorhizobium fredii]GLS08188.1 hypothetical protein GCM10007864_18170 [Sinorhizobium fredii]